jgi:Xaa-Pro aminopeptidase
MICECLVGSNTMSANFEYPSQVPYDWETRKKYQDLPFPMTEYERRLKGLREIMTRLGLDSTLVFGNSADYGDLVYLSNFIPFGKAAVVVPKEGELSIVTDAILHGEPINSFAWMTWIKDFLPVSHDTDKFAGLLGHVLMKSGKVRRIGLIGSDNIPVRIWERLKTDLEGELVDISFEFLSFKSIRSDLEIQLQREVGAITARAMRDAVESISEGRSEHEVAGIAYDSMFSGGAHDRSFQTIVNSGPRGGLKHSYPTDRKIQRGDLIYLDMGAMKYGYQCDMSRSVAVGGANEEQKRVLDVILNGYNTLTSMMKPGVKMSDIISKAHELEEKSGLRSKFKDKMYLGLIVHHAIATSFFELPSLGLSDVTLQRNMSFAFEPMAHILDFGTAVIEDTVLITSQGAESLTPYEIVHW